LKYLKETVEGMKIERNCTSSSTPVPKPIGSERLRFHYRDPI